MKRVQKASILILPWITWFLACLFYFHQYFLRVTLNTLRPHLESSLHINESGIASIAAVYFYTFVIVQLFAGITVDKFGARRSLVLATIICGIGTWIMGVANGESALYISRIFLAIGASFSLVAVLAIAKNHFSKRTFSIACGFTFTMGMAGAFMAEGPLARLTETFNWRFILQIAAIAFFVLSLIYWFVMPARNRSSQGQEQHEHFCWNNFKQHILKNSQIWIIIAILVATYPVIDTYASLWGSAFIVQYDHLRFDKANAIVSWIFVGFALGNVLWCLACNYAQPIKLLRISLILSFCTGAAIALQWHAHPIILMVLHFGLGFFIAGSTITMILIGHMIAGHLAASAFSAAEVCKHTFSALLLQALGFAIVYFKHNPNHSWFTNHESFILWSLLLSIFIGILFSLFIRPERGLNRI